MNTEDIEFRGWMQLEWPGRKRAPKIRSAQPICAGCGKRMASITTAPTKWECEENHYIRGRSGHAYHRHYDDDGTEGDCEIVQKWCRCRNCKRYFHLEDQHIMLHGMNGIGGIKVREEEHMVLLQARRAVEGKKFLFKQPQPLTNGSTVRVQRRSPLT